MFLLDGIILCKASDYHLNNLVELKNESWMGTHRVTIINRDDQTKWLNNIPSEPHAPGSLLLIAKDDDNRYLGCFYINNVDYINKNANVSWAVFQSYRNKGFGKKIVKAGCAVCFQILNLHRVNCEILGTNEHSTKCALNAGFIVEGMKRQSVYKLGKYLDSYVYGLLAEQFKCDLLQPMETND